MRSPRNAIIASGGALEQRPATPIEARTNATVPACYAKAHAVPVVDVVPSSGALAEAALRAFEILVSLIGITIGLPIMLIVAVLIRWDSPGPALFFQERMAESVKVRGRDLKGRVDLIPPPGGYEPDKFYYVPISFRFVKFRTMYHDARSRFPELYNYSYAPGEFQQKYFKSECDPRVTRVGQVLRRLTLDELPNLWCVLVGDVRFVGPRPELPDVVQYYTPEQMLKFACKPGITGLAQINGRGLLNWGETLAWDLHYVRARSVWLDLKIICTTLKYVITRRGAF